MTRTYFKSVRPTGTDFYAGTVRWLPAEGVIPEGGWVVEHPTSDHVVGSEESTYLSVSTVATDCTGMRWPCRLLKVVPDGSQVRIPEPEALPHKRASVRWRVIDELPAWQALGPQGREIETLLGQIESLTEDQALEICFAWDAALGAVRDAALGAVRAAAWCAVLGAVRDTAWYAVRGAVRGAALDAALDADRGADWDAAMSAVRDAARGLLVLDLEPDAAEILMAPWVSVMGRSWEVTA